jgi:hypothetical protein
MANTFEILSGFLDRFDDEVEGRELQQPAPEIQGKLREFAQGKLSEPEQNELIRMLTQNPHWVNGLADEVKAMRQGG